MFTDYLQTEQEAKLDQLSFKSYSFGSNNLISWKHNLREKQ